ncbi:MAG: hypothetical protein HZB34_11410 [Nitrospirae bacterium]|jgi:hypothetical protein|nr:hypothetical protein [Nitrospirota bacterium]
MTTWAGPEFGWVQALSWFIIIGFWLGVAFFGWKFFMENPMAKTGKERRKLESTILSSTESDSHEHEDDTKNPARDRSA